MSLKLRRGLKGYLSDKYRYFTAALKLRRGLKETYPRHDLSSFDFLNSEEDWKVTLLPGSNVLIFSLKLRRGLKAPNIPSLNDAILCLNSEEDWKSKAWGW